MCKHFFRDKAALKLSQVIQKEQTWVIYMYKKEIWTAKPMYDLDEPTKTITTVYKIM